MSLRDLIATFVERQYVIDEGHPRDNVERLFAPDLIYRTGEQSLGREDLVAVGDAVRATPRQDRFFALSDWEEQGLTVRWHLAARLPAMGPDGEDLVQESEVTAVFGTDGLVHEVRSHDTSSGPA